MARRRIQHDHSEEARKLFEEAVTTQRKKEHEDAEICRRRCKITWLKEGEAPSKYFFARMKAKHAQEEMTSLEDSTGGLIQGREEVLGAVHSFYEELYTAEPESEEMLEDRRRVVGRINRRLTAEQNLVLEAVPSEELITTIVMEVPKEKSPGIDGVMAEILKLGWEFMKDDCFLMVQCFWDRKRLTRKDSKGVIKLIPKNDRKQLLQNWRPITLLTMTYKIIAKVIAEWAQTTDQDVIFVKLDFMKAYDRIAHGFIWDTLSAMGMAEDLVERIRGLVIGGTSEVHINGCFTEDFKIGRGVRQGCPLAPLLFAMTTQPLMRALREEEMVGNLQNILDYINSLQTTQGFVSQQKKGSSTSSRR
ncbi:hypothetical protein R1sor_001153 [Riccia sorocarpa]|uniref:Reverse transcriptase domain-containing protein n=1 Tax=Riccia sorocarpa TaxID=122646 RepID=A0ABD3GX51_9MARC